MPSELINLQSYVGQWKEIFIINRLMNCLFLFFSKKKCSGRTYTHECHPMLYLFNLDVYSKVVTNIICSRLRPDVTMLNNWSLGTQLYQPPPPVGSEGLGPSSFSTRARTHIRWATLRAEDMG